MLIKKKKKKGCGGGGEGKFWKYHESISAVFMEMSQVISLEQVWLQALLVILAWQMCLSQ